ncbi:MAG: M48 family metalloprotease, partial [Kiritimatiellae bacterium]|nr:M48 family metalloprotease [Kiritimatiellia bacterium]
MDPFALQDEARRNTGRLVALAVLAVAAVVAAAAFVFACGAWTLFRFLIEEKDLAFWPFVLSPAVVGYSLLVSFLVVFIGFLVKSDDLSSPEKLMARIGAKQVVRSRTKGSDAKSLARLRLFNVCEEMSIASGVPMPSVWVLEDSGDVNAFVAGTTCDAASLCVTAGALRFLERDELQGVVAHEYSHILNGDMRLNFRLLLLVAGVTAFNSLGGGMLGMFGSHSDADESGRPNTRIRIPSGGKGGKGSGGVAIIILVYLATALLLWLIGSIGVFFARLVQCAVSRQREFLADASAAQFTRNPEALANALRLTYLAGMGRRGSAFDAWRDDVAHMLFTEGERTMFATHPSVRDRIARLSPRGIFADEELRARVKRIRAERKAASAARERARAEAGVQPGEGPAFPASAALSRANVGDVSVVGSPETRVEALPKEFLARLREPGGAGTALVQLLRGKVPEGLDAMPSRAEKRRIATRCTIAIRDVESEPARRKWADTLTAIAQEDGEID